MLRVAMLRCCAVMGSIVVLILYDLTRQLLSLSKSSSWSHFEDQRRIELRKIVDALYEWTGRRMADAAYNESKADEML
ncbi:MAG: hypothetical protein IJV42_10275 [Bacteroidaceae bacterium]|nr:hypothetical protein [Bacteroidaceae bacterium]